MSDDFPMTSQTRLRLALFLWTVAFVIAFLDFGFGAGGDALGFGLGSLERFGLWQGIAAVFAAWAWVVGGAAPRRSRQRVASRVPGVIQIAILIGVGLFLATAGLLSGSLVGAS